MKILVMSDSHGLTDEMSIITNRHKHDVTAMIHCGDSELVKGDLYMKGLIAVRGNCDYDQAYPNDVVEELAGKRFLITHGHLYSVKRTLLTLSYKRAETEADIVCFGHSHVAGSELIDGKLYMNPGSIFQPRNRKEKTYAILDIVDNQVKVMFYDIKGTIVAELSRMYQLA